MIELVYKNWTERGKTATDMKVNEALGLFCFTA